LLSVEPAWSCRKPVPPDSILDIDDTLRFGVTLAGLTRTSTLEQARRAERLGFDALWVTDHLAFHIPVTDALTLLAFAAATDRITPGTSILLLPLHAAAVAAKRAASVDMLSGGRLVLGVGVGGEYPAEFEAAGVAISQRGARCDEAIPLMRRRWSKDRVSHHGRFARGSLTGSRPYGR
jgi:alkanesulfonate monooxygenase SsuD/methylene tetrahydromethanopterin reductase-like flavin-dependent oxidoreductase (luciferase family)